MTTMNTTDQPQTLAVPLSADDHADATRAAAKLHHIGPADWAAYVVRRELARMQAAEAHADAWWCEATIHGGTVLARDHRQIEWGVSTPVPGGMEGDALWNEIAARMLHSGWLVLAHATDRSVCVRAATDVAITGEGLAPYVMARGERESVQVGTVDEHGRTRTLLEMGQFALRGLCRAASADARLYPERQYGWEDGYMAPVLDIIRAWGQQL